MVKRHSQEGSSLAVLRGVELCVNQSIVLSQNLLIDNTPLPSMDRANISSLNKMNELHTNTVISVHLERGEKRCSLAALSEANVRVDELKNSLIDQSIN